MLKKKGLGVSIILFQSRIYTPEKILYKFPYTRHS